MDLKRKVFLVTTVASAFVLICVSHNMSAELNVQTKSAENSKDLNQLPIVHQIARLLDFVRFRAGYCDRILEPFSGNGSILKTEFDAYLKTLHEYDKQVHGGSKKEKLEGYTAKYPMDTRVYWHLAQLQLFVKLDLMLDTAVSRGFL